MQRVHHIRFGSPFQVEENGEGREQDSEAQPLPVILWNAPAVLKCTNITEERAKNRERSNLGSVTVWVRGRRMDLDETPTSPIQKEPSNPGRALMPGYSVRAARIIAFVDDNCIVVPISSPLSDSCDGIHRRSSHEIQEREPLKLTDWLKLARRDSSQKAPLPRDWQYVPRPYVCIYEIVASPPCSLSHKLEHVKLSENSTSFPALFLLAFACVRLVICLRLRVRAMVLQVAAFA
jgi:hypothetical protein